MLDLPLPPQSQSRLYAICVVEELEKGIMDCDDHGDDYWDRFAHATLNYSILQHVFALKRIRGTAGLLCVWGFAPDIQDETPPGRNISGMKLIQVASHGS